MQKIVTLFDKLFINVDISQKRKFERSSKLSMTIFKSLIIIVDTFSTSKQNSSIVVVSSITTSFQSISTIIFSLILIEQKLAVMIFFKQVFIASKFNAIDFKSFVLK